ncbi:hypothetical protein ACIQU4_27365 [Streptomyces sp. NPDC090741]|uniref:hypothetical protein n=1 Tax=Streptomyces sp. NPDC090741 TaxID=3365967 RepID=UPI0037FF924E
MEARTARRAAAERVEALLPSRVREGLALNTSRVDEVVEVLFRYDPRTRGFGARASCVREHGSGAQDQYVGSIFRRDLDGLDVDLDVLSVHYRPRLGEFIRVDLARGTTTFHPGGE